MQSANSDNTERSSFAHVQAGGGDGSYATEILFVCSFCLTRLVD